MFPATEVDEAFPNAFAAALAGGTAHSVVLRSDGSAEAFGDKDNGKCDVPALDLCY